MTEKHRRKALNSDLIMLQYMEDSLRDRRKGSEKEMKKSRKDPNGTKRRLDDDGEETEATQKRSDNGKDKNEEEEIRICSDASRSSSNDDVRRTRQRETSTERAVQENGMKKKGRNYKNATDSRKSGT